MKTSITVRTSLIDLNKLPSDLDFIFNGFLQSRYEEVGGDEAARLHEQLTQLKKGIPIQGQGKTDE